MLIAQITDLHVSAEGPGNSLVDTAQHVEAAVAHLNAMSPSPDVVVATGDLINDGTVAEYRRLRGLLAPLQAPLLLIPGNHDDPEAMAEVFPEQAARVDGAPRPFDYVVDDYEVAIVALDTSVAEQAHGALTRQQVVWLDGVLTTRSQRPVLIAMHHPPFETGIWWMDAMGLDGAADFDIVLRRHPNVGKVVCGHIHRPITTTIGSASVMVTASTAHQVRLDLDGRAAGVTDEQSQLALHVWTGSMWVSHQTGFMIEQNVDIERVWPGFEDIAPELHASGPSVHNPAPAAHTA